MRLFAPEDAGARCCAHPLEAAGRVRSWLMAAARRGHIHGRRLGRVARQYVRAVRISHRRAALGMAWRSVSRKRQALAGAARGQAPPAPIPAGLVRAAHKSGAGRSSAPASGEICRLGRPKPACDGAEDFSIGPAAVRAWRCFRGFHRRRVATGVTAGPPTRTRAPEPGR